MPGVTIWFVDIVIFLVFAGKLNGGSKKHSMNNE